MKFFRFTLSIFFSIFAFGAFSQLTTSKLPIFLIDTKGQFILDEPKILVGLKVIYNGEGKENNISQSNYHYDSFLGIEFRGSSSQMFPKKPYGIELRNEKGENNPMALVGLPEDSDWVLFPSYNEKSLMHNVLTMSIARQLGMNASRTKYVEVVLNGDYQGVYVLMEKIKVDKNRVNIANLKPQDVTGDELTGGYVVKIDKNTGSNYGSFRSFFSNRNGVANDYYYHLPKTINEVQKTYIRDYIRKFESAVYGKDFKDETNGYRQFLDLPSFAKMFIINEVSRNMDGYRISSYFYKDKDSKGGKLTASPPWDYDIAFGNANYCVGWSTDFWAYRFNDLCPNDGWQVPAFWEKMVSDPKFIAEIRTIYFEQRKTGGVLDYERLLKEIEENKKLIEEAANRNYQRWPTLGVYIWPAPQPIPTTWTGEINELKTWLRQRLDWLDKNFPDEFVITGTENEINCLRVSAFPNPFVDKLHVSIHSSINQTADIVFSDTAGRVVIRENVKLKIGENDIDFNNIQEVNDFLFLKVKTKNGEQNLKKIVRLK